VLEWWSNGNHQLPTFNTQLPMKRNEGRQDSQDSPSDCGRPVWSALWLACPEASGNTALLLYKETPWNTEGTDGEGFHRRGKTGAGAIE